MEQQEKPRGSQQAQSERFGDRRGCLIAGRAARLGGKHRAERRQIR